MDAAARRLDQIRGELESVLQRFEWDGADASDFHDEWFGRLSPLIELAVTVLSGAAKSLVANANQQRAASGDSAVSGAASLVTLIASGAGALVHSTALDVAGKLDGIEGTVFDVADLKHVKAFIEPHVTGDVEMIGKVGDGLAAVGLGIDGVTLIGDLVSDPHSPDTYNATVNVAIDSTALAVGSVCPPAGVAVGIAGLVYTDYVETHYPHLSEDIVHGVGAAGKAVAETFAKTAQTDLAAIDAAGSVMSSGVRGALSHIHF